MFDSPTPASSSSSTLVSAASTSTSTPTPTSTQSPIHTSDTKAIPKPKLGLNTSLIGSGNNSPKMSDKGFIEPHASHLPRRVKGITNKRERTKTVSVPTSHEAQDLLQQQQQQQQLERLRERLQVYQRGTALESPDIPPDPLPQVSTQPHRDNVPRRNRANTVPNNIRTRRINVPPPIPISIVDSQSTIGADAIANPGQEAEAEEEEDEALSSLYPPPLKLNSKALSLISKAQNKAFKSGPSDLDHRQQSSSVPTSPQLPHPAMGLTMGIMEAYAAEELEDEVEVGRVHGFVRHGLSYSPALGVKGTPPPPLPSSTVFPVHTTRFVPVPESAPIPGSSVIPKIWVTTSSPVLPPASAPLGQNLPRRHHRCRQKSPGGEKEVLRVERVQVGVGRSKVEANEEEDGLFSPLLDFGRAGSVGETSFSSRGKRKGEEDERCIQVLGRSCVEVGYMPESEKGDYVLIEAIGQDEGVGGRLELCLRDDGREGVSSLLPEQVRAGCGFMKGWIGTRMRISVPRWRAQDGFGLAVCFLVWAGEKQVPVACLEPSEVYSPIHLLYMGLLDDGEEEEGEWGKGKGESERVGLGIDFGAEEGSAHSDSTNGSSRSRREPSVTLHTGLRDEWRGVLSYEGLNALAVVWP